MNISELTKDRLLGRKEAARYISEHHGVRISHYTLDKYASQGRGPKFMRWNRRAYYAREDLTKWFEQNLKGRYQSTSEYCNDSE